MPPWAWLAIAPCALATFAAIDRGTLLFGVQAPARSPWVTGLLAMIAVVVAASSAFGCAILARTRLPLSRRVLGCAAMAAATALTSWVGVPREAAASWRRVVTPSRRLSADWPGPAVFSERDAPGPRGGALLREAKVRAEGLLFVLQEREESAPAKAEALLEGARAELIAGGAQVLASRRDGEDLLLTVRMEVRRYRVRIRALPPLLWIATAGPEGQGDAALERFLGSLKEE